MSAAGGGGGRGGALPDPAVFLTPTAGNVEGRRQRALAVIADRVLDLRLRLSGGPRRVAQQAARVPPRDVLALCVYAPDSFAIEGIARELRRPGRHRVRMVLGSLGEAAHPELERWTVLTGLGRGKFRDVNALLEAADAGDEAPDWTIVLDDDVELAHRFIDNFLGLCEGVGLQIAQPAQTRLSHAAWPVVCRHGGSLVRETRFVEIGPVTAFSAAAAAELLPFPDVRFGWGLDNHWSAIAAERSWPIGVTDAVPVRHERRPIAVTYPREEAIEEARRLLSDRPYATASEAAVTVQSHRRIPAVGRHRHIPG